jgi:hypothetical protein
MSEQLKNDLDRVWQLSNDVATAAVAEELRALFRRLHDQEERRVKNEDEIRQDPEFQAIAAGLRSAGINEEESAFVTYREMRKKKGLP